MDTAIAVSDRVASYFKKAWRLALVEGIIAVGVGLLLMFRPAQTIVFMVGVLGVYWVVSGVFHAVSALFGTKEKGWWAKLAGGIVTAVLGALVVSYPIFSAAVSAFAITMAAASLVVIGGIMTAAWGFSLYSELPGEGWAVLSGILSVVLGIALFAAPVIAMRSLSIIVGLFALAGGIGDIISGFRLRSLAGRVTSVKNRVKERMSA